MGSSHSSRAAVRRRALLASLLCLAASGACIDPRRPDPTALAPTRLTTDRSYLRDGQGRYVFFHGVNVGGDSKAPLVDGQNVADYLVEPFPDSDAAAELARLKALGFNQIRLILLWEGIEPSVRGVYDEAYLAHIEHVVETANELGIYVLLDMHQDMFSRHLKVRYNNSPSEGTPGTVEHALLSLVEPYNDSVQGDGAPRWAVEACLQEKNMSSPSWGKPRLISGLTGDALVDIFHLYKRLAGGTGDEPPPDWVVKFIAGLRGEYAVNETTDLLPFSHWGLTHGLSVDVARCYACLFAGDRVFPGLDVDGVPVKEYLQSAYADAWRQVASRVARFPVVAGYDIINEPSGNFLVLGAVGALIQSGLPSSAQQFLIDVMGAENGQDLYDALVALRFLPPDTTPETLALWGLDKLDPLAALGLGNGFSETYGRPFYERVGQAILEEDPDAVIYYEDMASASTLTGSPAGGLAGMWENPLTRPQLPQTVFAPHFYVDIYPTFGFNVGSRSFGAEAVAHRDYRAGIEKARELAGYSMGNLPVVFGEFGTYFNFNGGAEASAAEGYAVSSELLDNYYEAFESMFQSNVVWCYARRNDPFYGDGWNHEDFSVLDWNGNPRSELAWSRPYARALAGKPIATHFHSDFHYYDPDKGEAVLRREFEVRYGSKETSAPSEIFVPRAQYPEGFYVWLSDGTAWFDAESRVLYHRPQRDEPGWEHWVRILPPLPNVEMTGWDYYFEGDLGMGGL